jgi:hypothetical protein
LTMFLMVTMVTHHEIRTQKYLQQLTGQLVVA